MTTLVPNTVRGKIKNRRAKQAIIGGIPAGGGRILRAPGLEF
jgi:hypothetical protein